MSPLLSHHRSSAAPPLWDRTSSRLQMPFSGCDRRLYSAQATDRLGNMNLLELPMASLSLLQTHKYWKVTTGILRAAESLHHTKATTLQELSEIRAVPCCDSQVWPCCSVQRKDSFGVVSQSARCSTHAVWASSHPLGPRTGHCFGRVKACSCMSVFGGASQNAQPAATASVAPDFPQTP